MKKTIILSFLSLFLVTQACQPNRDITMYGIKGSITFEKATIKGMPKIRHFSASSQLYEPFKANLISEGIVISDLNEILAVLEMVNIQQSVANEYHVDLIDSNLFVVVGQSLAILCKGADQFTCSFYPFPTI